MINLYIEIDQEPALMTYPLEHVISLQKAVTAPAPPKTASSSSTAPKASGNAPKAWHEGASTGDERWITIHPSDDPSNYKHVKVKLRANGKWRIIAGGQHLEHQEITPRHQLNDEDRQKLDDKKARMEATRKENAQHLDRLNEVKKQHDYEYAKILGIEPTLSQDTKTKLETKARDRAHDLGVEDVDSYVNIQLSRAQAMQKQTFNREKLKLLSAAAEVERAEDPEQAIANILKSRTSEVDSEIDNRAAEFAQGLPDGETADPQRPDWEEGRDILAQSGDQPFDQGELHPSELISPGHPTPDLREKTIYSPKRADMESIIGDDKKRRQLLALNQSAKAAEREYRQSRTSLGAQGASGTATLAQFNVSADEASEPQAERSVLERFENETRQRLNSTLIDMADSTYDEESGNFKAYGKKQYSVGKAQITGALDALTGIASEFLGASMIDRPLVESLGVEASAMLVAREVMTKLGRTGGESTLRSMEEYHKTNALNLARTALSSAEEAEEASQQVNAMANDQVFDKAGRPIAGKLLAASEATRLMGELKSEALRQVGTALGSLHASASVMQLIRGAMAGQKLDTIRLNINDPGDEAIINKNLRLKGKYTITNDPDSGQQQMVINPSAIKSFTKTALVQKEQSQEIKDIQSGKSPVNVAEVPKCWKKSFEDTDGKQAAFKWMEPQKRSVDFLTAHSDENGGGGVIDLEVGGGKTAMALGYIGNLRDKGYLKPGERAMYVAPDESLSDQVAQDAGKFTTLTTSVTPGNRVKSIDELKQKYQGNEDVTIVSAKRLSADVNFLASMGMSADDIGGFFRDLGFQAQIFDEAHKLVNGLSGGGNIGRNMRKMRGKYNCAMTGTLCTSAISQPFDLVRWAAGAKVESRAKVLRKYGDVGQGSEAWQKNVNDDVRRQIDPYIFHGSGAISAKLLPPVEQKVPISDKQKQLLGEATKADSDRRREWRAKQTASGKIGGEDAATLKNAYKRDVYDVLHDGDWHDNPRLQAIGQRIKETLAANPQKKFIICTDKISLKALDSLETMLRESGLGNDESIRRFASQSLTGKSLNARQMGKSKAEFNSDPNVRFALLSESHAIGKNLQGGDVIIHLDTPPDAASAKQRRGRAYRTGRTGDVQEMYFYTNDHSFDIDRRLNLKKTGGLLGAVSD